MEAIFFPKSFFSPKPTDGNLTLGTQGARIEVACECMRFGYWIKVDDTLCKTEEELKKTVKNG